MPQIAQQDYIKIHVNDTYAITDDEAREIMKHIKQGNILDCVLVEDYGVSPNFSEAYSKIIASVYVSDTNAKICVYSLGNGEIVVIDIDVS